ncbi:MAG: CDGSH iron-sulfur domain-containing protein [bacterium]
MSRLVRFSQKEPLPIECGDKKIWICMCGLSDKFPYCSGKHKYTKDEEEDKDYVYDQSYQKKQVEKIIFVE